MSKPSFFLGAGALLLAALVLTSAYNQRRMFGENEMNATLNSNKASATRCFGRYLVDLPSEIVLHAEGGQTIGEVQLDVVPMDRNQFDAVIASRMRELQSMLMSGPEKYPFLRKIIELPAPEMGLIFDHAKDPTSGGRITRELELLGWKDGYRISARIEAVDTSFPEDASEPALQALKPNLQENLAVVSDVFRRTTGRGDSLPSGQGVCILNGFVNGPAKDEESVTLGGFKYQAQHWVN